MLSTALRRSSSVKWPAETAGVIDMALWHLLILMCVALPVGTAAASVVCSDAA